MSTLATSRRRLAVAPLVALAFALPAIAHAAPRHFLYVESNVALPGQNAIFAYRLGDDGALTPITGSPFPTEGTGYFDSSYKLGPFDNDQNLVVDRRKDVLYAVNGGSNTIAAFRISWDGGLSPLLGSPFRAHGSNPVSLGIHGGNLVALGSAEDPAQASHNYLPRLTVSRIERDGRLDFQPFSTYFFPSGVQPGQALTTNTGPFVFTQEFPAGGHLRAFYQYPDGYLYHTDTVTLPVEPAGQALPLGLWASPNGPYLYVGFVNTSQLGVYSWNNAGKLTLVTAAPNSGKAICWIRTSRDGKYIYTVNTADQSMSVYDASTPSAPVEIQHVIVPGSVGGLEQMSLDTEGKFLYVIEQENSPASAGKAGKIHVLSIDPSAGTLTPLDSLTTTLPIPPNTRPIGVAIR